VKPLAHNEELRRSSYCLYDPNLQLHRPMSDLPVRRVWENKTLKHTSSSAELARNVGQLREVGIEETRSALLCTRRDQRGGPSMGHG